MGEVKQINIKNRTNFEPDLLTVDRKSYKNIGIYNIGYVTIKEIDDCESTYGINPLYLVVNHANGYILKKKMEINKRATKKILRRLEWN